MAEQQTKGHDENFCESCGEIIKSLAEICPKCGVRQKVKPTKIKSKSTAGVLALLVGGIGIHKFYLGQTGMGILYIVGCWTGIPLFVGLVEAIMYFSMSEEKFEEKYCT